MQVSFNPLAAGLEHQSAPFVLSLAEGGSGIQHQRAEEGSVRSGRALWPAGQRRQEIGLDGVDDGPLRPTLAARSPCLVRVYFVDEHPAGDHMLVLARVIDGKLLDVASRGFVLPRNRSDGRRFWLCFPTCLAIDDAALGTIRVYHECANGSVKSVELILSYSRLAFVGLRLERL